MQEPKISLTRTRPGIDPAVDQSFLEMEAARPSIAIVTNLDDDASAKKLFDIFGRKFRMYRSMEDLAKYGNEEALVSFSTALIIPPEIYSRFPQGAYNLHAASPEFPGRDPHHWAVYQGATRYGATLHVMSEKVDAGPIVDVEMFDVASGATPSALLDLANEAAYRLLDRHAAALLSGVRLTPRGDIQWSGVKHSRKDFRAMCDIGPDISAKEFARRYLAFDGGHFDNLTTIIHGHRFRIEKAKQGQ